MCDHLNNSIIFVDISMHYSPLMASVMYECVNMILIVGTHRE